MSRRRVKIVWGGSEVIKGNWFLGVVGLYDRAEGEREDGIAISLRGLTRWAVAGVVIGYFAATAVVFSFWHRNPYSTLTYGDAFFYPIRRAEIRAKKGQAFIAEGQDLIKANKWYDGSRYLRQGLGLFPGDLRGRMALARFYILINARGEALAVLKEGLTRDYPGRNYLQLYIEIAGQGEDYALVNSVADQYLAVTKNESPPVEWRWLSAQKFSALLSWHRGAEALAWTEANDTGPVQAEHRVLALLELSRATEALDYLAEWAKTPGADLKLVSRLRVRALRDAGRGEEMERAIEEMRAQSPGDVRAALFGVVQRVMAKREESARAALDDFIFRYGGTAANLSMAAEPLIEVGNLTLFEKVMAAAAERGYPLQSFRMQHVQLLLQKGRWTEAAAELAQIKPVPGGTWKAREQLWYEWTSRLVGAVSGPSDGGVGALLEFFRGRPWLLSMFKSSVEALRLAGRTEAASDLVRQAEGTFPNSPWVQAQKKEIADELAAKRPVTTPAAVTPVASTKRPTSKEALVPVAKPVPVEVDFTTALADALRDKRWLDARRLIAEATSVRPHLEWIEKREGEIRLAETRIAHGLGEKPAMLLAVRLYLNGSVERANTILALAAEVYAAGDKASGILLVEEVLRRVPNHGQAKKTLAEWKPPAVPAKK